MSADNTFLLGTFKWPTYLYPSPITRVPYVSTWSSIFKLGKRARIINSSHPKRQKKKIKSSNSPVEKGEESGGGGVAEESSLIATIKLDNYINTGFI